MITTATLISGLAQGLIWAIMTLGVYITFRILDIADLTVEGTFPLGAAVTAVLINSGIHPVLAVFMAVLAGSLAGFVTGIFHTVFKIPAILSGILTMIALYSVNIRIMSDKATVAIEKPSVKKLMQNLLPQGTASNTISIILGVTVCIALVALLYYFFGTEIGCAVRATGSNQNMARSLGVRTDRIIMLGLMISNALVALSGSLIAQLDYGSALVNMGQGTIVIGLASVIIGEVIFIRKDRNFAVKLMAIIAGAIIYRTIIACALTFSFLKATDLKIITAVIVSIALALPVIKQNISEKKLRADNARRLDSQLKDAEIGGESIA
ncbi:MAG: ABC transporter permease [Firmicutes bacterium]|nr:ABC transporter permease [Bacillota bacterium]